MRVHPFRIPATVESAIGLQEDHVPHFYDIFHQHQEIQLTLIEESTGTLFLDDYVGEFRPGNIFIIGANVPHVFKNDKVYYNSDNSEQAKSTSVYFREDLFGKDFFQAPEAWKIRDFLTKTKRCLKFTSSAFPKLFPLIQSLHHAQDTDRIITFFSILKILSEEEFTYLTHQSLERNVDDIEGKRLGSIFQFTMNEFGREISIEEVAGIANLTRTSFCRYFKKRTRKTYIDFLLQVRISHACNLLLKPDLTIGEISDLCGFNNISNFNRQFKKIKGIAPTEFRRKTI
jgi:AraC-like DNA-binding protein